MGLYILAHFLCLGKDGLMFTDEQKKQITKMRLEGMGYKTIAANLGGGVRRENVRYFCKSRGLVGTKELIALNYDVQREDAEHCKQCGIRLQRNKHSGRKLFCSDKCRRDWWSKNPNEATRKKPYELTCKYCQTKFISYGKPDRKYCSHDCYIKDRFWTDPDAELTKDEVKKRQEAKHKPKEEKELKLRRIS